MYVHTLLVMYVCTSVAELSQQSIYLTYLVLLGPSSPLPLLQPPPRFVFARLAAFSNPLTYFLCSTYSVHNGHFCCLTRASGSIDTRCCTLTRASAPPPSRLTGQSINFHFDTHALVPFVAFSDRGPGLAPSIPE